MHKILQATAMASIVVRKFNIYMRQEVKISQIERQLLREKQTVATCFLCTNEGRLTAMSGHSQANKTR